MAGSNKAFADQSLRAAIAQSNTDLVYDRLVDVHDELLNAEDEDVVLNVVSPEIMIIDILKKDH